jgi:hypothetical protein
VLLPHRWTNGKVLFASGSPFDPIVDAAGVTHYPAQANNAYIFPAVGYAAVLAQAREITDEVCVGDGCGGFGVKETGICACLHALSAAGILSC